MKTRPTIRTTGILTLAGLFSFSVAACSSLDIGVGPDPGEDVTTMSLEVVIAPSGSGAGITAGGETASSVTVEDDENTLIISGVGTNGIVVQDLQVRKLPVEGDCPKGEEAQDPDIEQCATLAPGPDVLDLTTAIQQGEEFFGTVVVEEGTYDRVEITTVAPSALGTPEFFQRNPEWPPNPAASVRINGTLNGEAFQFHHDLEEELRVDFDEPLVLSDTDDAIITLRFDLASWFVDDDGNIIDPETALPEGDNEDQVRENILGSLTVSATITD